MINYTNFYIYSFLTLTFLSACSISTSKKYQDSKLSKFVANQTTTIIEESISEDFIDLQRRIKSLENKLNNINTNQKDTSVLDRLNYMEIIYSNSTVVFLFFEKNTTIIDDISIRFLDNWRLNAINKQLDNNKIKITAYSDFTGDSLHNIRLTESRNLMVKNYIKDNFCINDSNIISINHPNVLSCNKQIFRSVKIEILFDDK